jgi:HD-like signal output (HDOD) protein
VDTPAVALPVDSPSLALNEQGRRQRRLLEILNEGLPPFPHTLLELTAILSSPSADVKKAAKLIRTDPSLSAQVLRMCNSPLFGLRSRVISIEQASTLLGADRLRTLALTTSMVDFAGHGLPREQVTSFWHHSFLAALLSEHLAKRREYREKEASLHRWTTP